MSCRVPLYSPPGLPCLGDCYNIEIGETGTESEVGEEGEVEARKIGTEIDEGSEAGVSTEGVFLFVFGWSVVVV